MKKIKTQYTLTRYISEDGEEFAHEAECLAHEDLMKSKKLKCTLIKKKRAAWDSPTSPISELYSIYVIFSGKEAKAKLTVYDQPCKGKAAIFVSDSRHGCCHINRHFDHLAQETTAVVQGALLDAGIKFNNDITRRKDCVANGEARESIHKALLLAASVMGIQDPWVFKAL